MWSTLLILCALFCPVAVSLGFDGSQFMEIPLPEESVTEVEDITLRFRTERQDGLLFATLSNTSVDRLEVMLDAGQLRLDINLGFGTKVSTTFPFNSI
jgi:leucine-rich repeat transmembrane neuronal protein 1/2